MGFVLGNAQHIPLANESVHAVVTSPPYWGMRDYGVPALIWGGEEDCTHQFEAVGNDYCGQFCVHCGAWRGALGLEPSPELYIEHLVSICREVWRVLRSDGTFWLNLGDTYYGSRGRAAKLAARAHHLKTKDLVGIPWRVALALQADGWCLRSDIIWAKPNPMPESVQDRPTRSHEHVFLLTKSPQYYYDYIAVQERAQYDGRHDTLMKGSPKYANAVGLLAPPNSVWAKRHERWPNRILTDDGVQIMRNRRDVWTIPLRPYSKAHFATFPPDLARLCILAATSEGGCCPLCGAPRVRVVEKVHDAQRRFTEPEEGYKASQEELGQYDFGEAVGYSKTVGWRPSCDCAPCGDFSDTDICTLYSLDPVPCIVLDPFSGSGTTVMVAEELGRIGIGLEIKEQYIQLGRERLADAHARRLF